jgi:site-specific recombinase XerD
VVDFRAVRANSYPGWGYLSIYQWGGREAATYNRNLDALRSAVGFWAAEGWIDRDPTATLRRRPRPANRTRALLRSEVEDLLSRDDVALREKTLWRLLYETAARANEGLCQQTRKYCIR